MMFWRMLWNIKAPPKVLSVIWRAVHHCLPTKTQLQVKHVQIDNICPMCNEEVESIKHALVHCKVAARCWQVFNPSIVTEGNMEFSAWLEHALTGQSSNDRAKIITLCWSIWRSRNDFVWNKTRWPIMKIVAKAWEYLSQWTRTQGRTFMASLQAPVLGDGAIYWVKPHQNEVKITVDAAIFVDEGVSGIGLVARGFLEAMHPTLAEAIAVKEALRWVKDMGWSMATIESDCLVVVQMIRSAAPMRSRLGQVVEECRKLMRESNNLKLYFIKRSANMPAHELAHVAHMYPDGTFDWSSVPVNVRNCILNDLE